MVNITLNTYSNLSNKEEALVYVHPIYKEDSQTLYGFSDKSEREIFTLLISVSGVGGNTARVILSSLTADEVKQCIASENVGLLKSVKGIGAKTAERIIVDLKDKVLRIAPTESTTISASGSKSREAVSALEVLGYQAKQIEQLISKIQSAQPDISLEELIKQALKQL